MHNIEIPADLAEVIAAHRALFGGFVMEGDGAPTPQDGGGSDEAGYPANTPVREMTDAQQAAYWKAKSRGWESKAKGREDYDAVVAERDALKQSALTDQEKAVQQAVDTAVEQERVSGNARVAALEARLALIDAGVPPKLAAALNPAAVTGDDGQIDPQKVADLISATPKQQMPDMGAGRRGLTTGPSKAEAGREEARRRGYIQDPKEV